MTLVASLLKLPRLASRPIIRTSQLFRTSSTRLLGQRRREGQVKVLMETQVENSKRPKILCLHGFRTSAVILRTLIGRWPQAVLEKLELDFLDGPFPARGRSDVEGLFDPPYREWYQISEDFKEYRNFEECLMYIEDYMLNRGPFDGLLGFSQGAFISAALPGLQAQGLAFTRVPKVKFLILISGAKFAGYKLGQPKLGAKAFSSPIECPSLHFIGERDFLKEAGEDLVGSFVDPVVVYHPQGHAVPRLDVKSEETILSFIENIKHNCATSNKLPVIELKPSL
ncbi:hypothetical protein K2173_014871 [Erythroxylum novogranatense]|uniref:Serine hydrolase domain-containing protein n=1 Tax=Erythroxylum novogranatense TaxID=1862640 RepID=A0AAV8TID0_9ROSI|nr:hypothetical protein K2173_014871 [Erythroxylum novogranatense]